MCLVSVNLTEEKLNNENNIIIVDVTYFCRFSTHLVRKKIIYTIYTKFDLFYIVYTRFQNN